MRTIDRFHLIELAIRLAEFRREQRRLQTFVSRLRQEPAFIIAERGVRQELRDDEEKNGERPKDDERSHSAAEPALLARAFVAAPELVRRHHRDERDHADEKREEEDTVGSPLFA